MDRYVSAEEERILFKMASLRFDFDESTLTLLIAKVSNVDQGGIEQVLVFELRTGVGMDEDKGESHGTHNGRAKSDHKCAHG